MTRNRHGSPAQVIVNKHSTPLWQDIAKKTAEAIPNEVIHNHFDGGHEVEHKSKLNIRAQQIAVGLPMDELMFSKFMINFLGLNVMPWDAIITTASTYLPDARNQIHNIFINKTEGTHLLMLDSDVLPPPDFINRMLKHDKAVVGGYYRKKEKYPMKQLDGSIVPVQRPVVYDYAGMEDGKDLFSQRVLPGKGLERVDGAGAGAWLMRRDVALALGQSPYDMASGGEDLKLCRRITQAGFEMFVDWDCPCAHCGVFFV